MIDTGIVREVGNQAVTIINTITGAAVALVGALSFLWGHSHGKKKALKNIQVEGSKKG